MLEEKFKDLIENHLEEIMVITDRRAKILWANRWFTELTGYTFEEVKGKKPGDFLQGEETDDDTIQIMRKAISNGEGFNVNLVNYSKTNRKYWLNINCNPIHNDEGEVEYFVAVERDITAEHYNNQKRLNRLIDQQQKLASQKVELVESISLLAHDLKAPLSNIQGLIGISKMADESLKDLILREIHRSKNLINKILDNKNDKEKINISIESLRICQVIEYLIDVNRVAQEKASDKETIINCSKNSTIETDKVLFTQIIENLYTNAIKYALPNTKIIFKVEEFDDLVSIDISNETNSLEEWQLENIFKPFQNFSMSNNEVSNGMGSYIIKKHLAILGGTIEPRLEGNRIHFEILLPKEGALLMQP